MKILAVIESYSWLSSWWILLFRRLLYCAIPILVWAIDRYAIVKIVVKKPETFDIVFYLSCLKLWRALLWHLCDLHAAIYIYIYMFCFVILGSYQVIFVFFLYCVIVTQANFHLTHHECSVLLCAKCDFFLPRLIQCHVYFHLQWTYVMVCLMIQAGGSPTVCPILCKWPWSFAWSCSICGAILWLCRFKFGVTSLFSLIISFVHCYKYMLCKKKSVI